MPRPTVNSQQAPRASPAPVLRDGVTSVLAEMPETSHLQFDAVVPAATVPPTRQDNWTGFPFYTYVKLSEGASVVAFEEKLHTTARDYGAMNIRESFNFPLEEITCEFPTKPPDRSSVLRLRTGPDHDSLDLRGHRTVHPAHCLYQLYEPGDGAGQ